MDWRTTRRKCPVGWRKGESFLFRPVQAIYLYGCKLKHVICLNFAARVHHHSLFFVILYKENHSVPTLVLAAALAPCGLDQPGISLPPRLSQGGTPPPLCPGDDRESQSTAVCLLARLLLCVPSVLQTWWKATSLVSFSAEKWRFSPSRLSAYPLCTTLQSWTREGSCAGPAPPYLQAQM